jgi:hypothetical protein
MKRLWRIGWTTVAVLAFMMTAAHAEEDLLTGEIPPELGRWRSWVLHGHEEKLCPAAFNNGTVVRCQWPSQLEIDISADGGTFEQHWMIFAEGWAALPGHRDMWPDGVLVDGSSAAVIDREGIPSVRLEPGEHQIKGRFYWTRLPEMVRVPPSVGLLSLVLDGRRIASPLIDSQGRLWLRSIESRAADEERAKVRIFRLIDDAIPMRITTLLRLDVSGQAREIRFKNVLLQNSVPMELTSALPARLDADGQLLVQARPGSWEVRVVARMPDITGKIGIGQTPYGDEVWSFKPQHDLRMVEIQGVAQIEPGQTEMPDAWRGFPAYLVKPGQAMTLKEIRRGDPDPAPDQLTLFRRWWLDFDGGGFTLHDRVDGTLSRQWYLAMNAPVVLGRVSIDGRDQVITAQGDGPKAGVELRQGRLRLQSDARLDRHWDALNAVGWDHDFQKVTAELNLPPGWRLLAATGVDHATHTWLQEWSLLDFFLVLIIGLAVFKLRGWRWGVLSLAVMALVFHEPGAPRLVWLHILAVLALLPFLPEGWFKRLVALWGVGAVAFLILVVLPFAVHQIRWGLYPQLAPHNDYRTAGQESIAEYEADTEETPQEQKARLMSRAPLKSLQGYAAAPEPLSAQRVERSGKAVWHQEPDALVPTGPGLPDWRWNTVGLSWSGPVAKDQTLRLILLSPLVNLLLALVRVVLLGLLIWGVVDWKPWWRRIQPHLKAGAALTPVLFICCLIRWTPPAAADYPFPPAELLEQLRQRLLEPSDCLPHCADISRMELAVSGDDLQLMLKVNAAVETAVPLPVNRKSWAPDEILMDNAPIGGLARDNGGGLWAVVPAGLHTVVLLGSLAQEAMIQIPLPLKPHIATYVARGWQVEGILPDGSVGSSLQVTRIVPRGGRTAAGRGNDAIPAFLQVRRVLHLGLTWQVHTTVQRVTALGVPIVAGIPLLAGEAVTTAGLQVDQHQVLINMSADQRQVSYTSTLKTAPEIQLTAPRAVPWTEIWILDASPIWHCDLKGIAVVHHQDRGGQWQPRWQPWPGESVTISVHRPQALEGQVVTLQQVGLALTPGQRFGRGELTLKINTNRGGQHTVELPPRANLQSVAVNGKSLPVRQDGQWVTVPLQPGQQSVALRWHQLRPLSAFFRAPPVGIDHKAVNARMTVQMPHNRWILMTGGPRWGPAVLFWSYLIVIVLVSLGLSRLTITPLKTWQWILLGLGMTQIPAPMALIIVGWLLALGLREKRSMPARWLAFNSLQIGLAVLTGVALVSLFSAVKAGLAGAPEMQIAGNGSTAWSLHWTQDRIGANLPRPWIVSLPVGFYRGLMLVWSLWLAYTLLAWLKWGWSCFAKGGAWKKKPPRAPKAAKPKPGAPAE